MPKGPKQAVTFGVSFNEQLLEKIDADRGDIPRSKYILRLVEEAYAHRELKGKK